jgi:hypothetical protein
MKKRVTKLSLHKETLRDLQSRELFQAAGAGTTSFRCEPTGCDCATQGVGCTLPPSACFGTCSC